MIDQMYDRGYQHGRAALNAGFAAAARGLARTIGDGLGALHRLEWSAPWAHIARPPQCH